MHKGMKYHMQAAALGLVAGMRSASAPALISNYISWRRSSVPPSPQTADTFLGFLSSPMINNVLRLFALGEMMADKLPFVPKRTEIPSLITRAVSGGIAGAGIGSVNRRSAVVPALIGALSATGATYGVYKIRKKAARNTILPDPLLGLLEDFLVLGISYSFRQQAAASKAQQLPVNSHETAAA